MEGEIRVSGFSIARLGCCRWRDGSDRPCRRNSSCRSKAAMKSRSFHHEHSSCQIRSPTSSLELPGSTARRVVVLGVQPPLVLSASGVASGGILRLPFARSNLPAVRGLGLGFHPPYCHLRCRCRHLAFLGFHSPGMAPGRSWAGSSASIRLPSPSRGPVLSGLGLPSISRCGRSGALAWGFVGFHSPPVRGFPSIRGLGLPAAAVSTAVRPADFRLLDSELRFFQPPDLPPPDRGSGLDFQPPPRRGASCRDGRSGRPVADWGPA